MPNKIPRKKPIRTPKMPVAKPIKPKAVKPKQNRVRGKNKDMVRPATPNAGGRWKL